MKYIFWVLGGLFLLLILSAISIYLFPGMVSNPKRDAKRLFEDYVVKPVPKGIVLKGGDGVITMASSNVMIDFEIQDQAALDVIKTYGNFILLEGQELEGAKARFDHGIFIPESIYLKRGDPNIYILVRGDNGIVYYTR